MRDADETPALDDEQVRAPPGVRPPHLLLLCQEMDGGHYISLSRPRELADRLAAYAAEAH